MKMKFGNAPGSLQSPSWSPPEVQGPLTQTKLVPPRLPSRLVASARHDPMIEGILQNNVCLVRAASGYGKSTLCTSWYHMFARRGYLTGWVSFDRDDDDPGRALTYILQAVWQTLKRHGTNSDVPLVYDGLIPPQSLAAHCINAVHEIDEQFVLFLDDFDRVTDTQVLQFMTYLLLHCPENLHVVLTCQTQPALPLSYLDAHANLMRIGTDELRLNDDEAFELLVNTSTFFDRDKAQRLNEAMAGWVTGLRIGAAALRNNSDALDEIGLVSHGAHWLSDYLDDNIFQHLTSVSRDFLMHCSIVETITADLGVCLSGVPEAARMLTWLADQNLFIQRLDDAGLWFRIHPIFRKFLLNKLRLAKPDVSAKLHHIASQWYANHHLMAEAIRHAIDAGDNDAAAELLAVAAMPMVERSEILTLLGWIAQLPDAAVTRHIPLRLAQAWALTLSLRPQARQLLDDLRRQIAAVSDPQLGATYRTEIDGIETIFLAVYEDEIDAALDHGYAFLSGKLDENRFVSRAVRNAVAYCEAERGHFSRVPGIIRPSQLQALHNEQVFTTTYRHAVVGNAYRQQGQLLEAERTFKSGVDLAERLAGRNSASAVLIAAFFARSLYERGALSEAKAVLDGRLPVIDEACYHEAVINAYGVSVRLAALGGDHDEAARLIERAELLGHERGWRRLLAHCAVERVRLNLPLTMDLDALLPVALETSVIDHPLQSDARIFAALAEARLKLALREGNLTRAQSVADRFATLAKRHGGAVLQLMSGLFFQLVGAPAMPVTISGFDRSISDVMADSVISALRAHIKPSTKGTVFSILSSREIDVLTGVGHGLSNKEIARQLHLTPETVKWHLKNIMRKLNAENRTAAVSQAVRLGLSSLEL